MWLPKTVHIADICEQTKCLPDGEEEHVKLKLFVTR